MKRNYVVRKVPKLGSPITKERNSIHYTNLTKEEAMKFNKTHTNYDVFIFEWNADHSGFN